MSHFHANSKTYILEAQKVLAELGLMWSLHCVIHKTMGPWYLIMHSASEAGDKQLIVSFIKILLSLMLLRHRDNECMSAITLPQSRHKKVLLFANNWYGAAK